jgi:hypothetical protein
VTSTVSASLRRRFRQLDLVAQRAMDRQCPRQRRHGGGVADLAHESVDQRVAEILAAEPGIARRRAHLHDAFEAMQQRDIERAAAQIDHQQQLLLLIVADSISQRRSGRLGQQPAYIEPGKRARGLRRLALQIVEIGRNGDDRFLDRLAKIGLGISLERAEHQRGQLLRAEIALAERENAVRAHIALEDRSSARRMGGQPLARRQADQHLVIVANADD